MQGLLIGLWHDWLLLKKIEKIVEKLQEGGEKN